MKYKNKAEERLKDRLTRNTSTDKIVSANKMDKSKSLERSAKFNIGKIVNKTSEHDKTVERVEDKTSETPDNPEVKQVGVKVFYKNNIPYIKYKNNDIQISQLGKLTKTDNDVRELVNTINEKKKAMNDTGSFNAFLLKQYS